MSTPMSSPSPSSPPLPNSPPLQATSVPQAGSPNRRKRPPSRHLIRHVLRARLEAARTLSAFFHTLQTAPEDKRVHACMHLAKQYGSIEEVSYDALGQAQPTSKVGYRSAKEVVEFLRSRGAKIAALSTKDAGDYWATSALSSEGELDTDADLSDSAIGPSKTE